MQIEQRQWTQEHQWMPAQSQLFAEAQLVLTFGGTAALSRQTLFSELKEAYPQACIVGCSTAGEIIKTEVHDDSVVTTAIAFDKTKIQSASVAVEAGKTSNDLGAALAKQLPTADLKHVFVLSDGLNVNGSDLVNGMMSVLPQGVAVTGGLSGDGSNFKKTVVILNGPAKDKQVVAVGFYGNSLQVGFGSLGGWDPFGPDRLVTKSKGNVLYELDGKPALALYKEYLGEHAQGLPSTALLFPLSIRCEDQREFVRTVLSVNEEDQSMTFAGDIPEKSYSRLMKANFDRLIDGAEGAAKTSYRALGEQGSELAILISCVGRKLVLKQRTEEEVEAVQEVLGRQTVLTGFYSYGEICPVAPNASCELHNQTMTITSFKEI